MRWQAAVLLAKIARRHGFLSCHNPHSLLRADTCWNSCGSFHGFGEKEETHQRRPRQCAAAGGVPLFNFAEAEKKMSLLRPGPVLVALLFGLVGVLAACGGGSSSIASESGASSASLSSFATGDTGPKAPAFSVSTGGDSAFSLDEHAGEVVLLYFSFPG